MNYSWKTQCVRVPATLWNWFTKNGAHGETNHLLLWFHSCTLSYRELARALAEKTSLLMEFMDLTCFVCIYFRFHIFTTASHHHQYTLPHRLHICKMSSTFFISYCFTARMTNILQCVEHHHLIWFRTAHTIHMWICLKLNWKDVHVQAMNFLSFPWIPSILNIWNWCIWKYNKIWKLVEGEFGLNKWR